MSRRLALVLVAITALALPGTASAVTTKTDYAPNNPAADTSPRTFVTSADGWNGTQTAVGPLCALVITCPGVANNYVATGGINQGPGNDGFIRTAFSTPGLVGVATDLTSVRGIWTGPVFTYNGDAGNAPDQVRFLLSRRSNAGTLVNVPIDNEIAYSVDLVPAGSGAEAVSLISEETVDGPTNFAPRGAVEVDPSDLVMGAQYQVRIITRYSAVAGVLPSATVDYDNVILRAISIQGTPGATGATGATGSNGAPGTNGTNGANGAQGPKGDKGEKGERGQNGDRGPRGSNGNNGESPQDRALKNFLRGVKGKISAKRTGRRTIKAKLACPKKVDGDCEFNVLGLINRFEDRITKTEKTRIKNGKTKQITLHIINNRVKEIDGRGRITLQATVEAQVDGKSAKTTIFYRPKISNNNRGDH